MSEEVKEVAAPESSATPAPAPAASEASLEVTKPIQSKDERDAAAAAASAAPAFTPNYKFKVMDEEKEIDEFVRGVIKDADTEKKVRELYEKAYGLDYVKPKYEELKKKLPETESKYTDLYSKVENLVQLRDKDFWGFVQQVGLTKEQVAKHVLEEVKRLELPEDQKRMYDEFEQTRRREIELERQLQFEQARSQEMAVQERTFQLDTILNKPEIAAYAKAYDTAQKQTGAFKDLVVERGITAWHTQKKDITPEQAVQEVMARLGEHYRGSAAASTAQPQVVQASEEKPLPVIPRVSGKAVSPTGKAPRSIDDLKRMAAELTR
jgi:hypothetical protein